MHRIGGANKSRVASARLERAFELGESATQIAIADVRSQRARECAPAGGVIDARPTIISRGQMRCVHRHELRLTCQRILQADARQTIFAQKGMITACCTAFTTTGCAAESEYRRRLSTFPWWCIFRAGACREHLGRKRRVVARCVGGEDDTHTVGTPARAAATASSASFRTAACGQVSVQALRRDWMVAKRSSHQEVNKAR